MKTLEIVVCCLLKLHSLNRKISLVVFFYAACVLLCVLQISILLLHVISETLRLCLQLL